MRISKMLGATMVAGAIATGDAAAGATSKPSSDARPATCTRREHELAHR